MNIVEFVMQSTSTKDGATKDSVDLFFTHVSAKAGAGLFACDALHLEFLRLTKEHQGEFSKVDPLDGKEHNYIELGGWLGSQHVALRYMGLGVLVGVFDVFTPNNVMPFLEPELKQLLAGSGLVTVKRRDSH